MPLLYVAYDLVRPGQDYQRIWDWLGQRGARRVLMSDGLLRTDLAPLDVVNALIPFLLDANDRLFVARLDGPYAWYRPINDPRQV